MRGLKLLVGKRLLVLVVMLVLRVVEAKINRVRVVVLRRDRHRRRFSGWTQKSAVVVIATV